MAVVTFDVAAWKARYPEFAPVPDATAQSYFDEVSSLYLDNTDASRVGDVDRRKVLLWLLVAHMAYLNYGINGQGPSNIVGRVSSASQGSVSVSADVAGVPGTAFWFLQSRYGAQFWQATGWMRRGQYVPGPDRLPNTSTLPF